MGRDEMLNEQEFPVDEIVTPEEETPSDIPCTPITASRLGFRYSIDFLMAILLGTVFLLPIFFFIQGTEFELLFGALFTQLGFLAVGLYRIRQIRKQGQPFLPMFEGPLGPALRWGLIAGIILFVLNVLHGCFLEFYMDVDLAENNPWIAMENFSFWTKVGTFAVGGIMAPIVEELMLRGVMFGSFAASGYPIIGTLFTMILFVILHLDPINSVAYAMLGLGFLWVYSRTRNLTAAILAHAMNNLLGFLFILIP